MSFLAQIFNTNFASFFVTAKQGGNYTSRTVKVKGAIQSIGMDSESKHLAIGTDKGFVSPLIYN